MKKSKIVIIDMYIECSRCLHSNESTVSSYQPLKEALVILDKRIADIKLKQQVLEENIKAFTIDKKKKRLQLALLTDAMRKKVQAVMLSHQDHFSFVKAGVTKSAITSPSATKALARANNIYEMANAISATDKTLFNISANELNAFKKAIKDFDDAHGARRGSLVGKQNAGVDLDGMIKSTSNYIRTTINSLMGNYQVTDPSFFNAMVLAQRIMNAASRHAQITGKVIDATTEQPLERVRVKATNGTTVYEDMTDKNGVYKIPVNPEIWSISFELPAYNAKDFSNIAVDSGERQRINTALNHT